MHVHTDLATLREDGCGAEPALMARPLDLRGSSGCEPLLRKLRQLEISARLDEMRLCRFFGLSDGYWLRAQAAHDTAVAREALAPTLARIHPWQQHQAD